VLGGALMSCIDRLDPVASGNVARQTPTITRVMTTDGFTQVCQGCTVDIVITGSGLASTRDVTLLPPGGAPDRLIVATILHTSNGEIRARVATPDGAQVASYDLTTDGPQGTATAASALEVTPIVVSPSVLPGGHGTFQSPVLLCDPLVDQVGEFDVVLLLAGVHTCDHVFHFPIGVEVVGQGTGVTHVSGQGAGIGFDFAGTGTGFAVVQDLTIEGVVPGPSIHMDDGLLLVSNVDDHGGGIVLTNGNQPVIDHYRFDGPGRGLVIDTILHARLSNIEIQNCAEGAILTGTDAIEISGLTVKHCGLGLRLGGLPPAHPDEPSRLFALLTGVHLTDNAAGIVVQDGHLLSDGMVIDDDVTTPLAPTTAVRVENGSLSMANTEITGHAIGFDIDTQSAAGSGAITLNTATIVGGQVGIRVRAFDRGTNLQLITITGRDQTVAGLEVDQLDFLDTAGHSDLSVSSGFAIDDRRTVITPAGSSMVVTAMTLNGHSFGDQRLQGPVSIGSDIRITSPDASWQFRTR
jgi:hypothetical protein